MNNSQPFVNYLSICQHGKVIPYGGLGDVRDDGDANYGFRFAKGKPDVLDWIPELQRDQALDQLVRAINGIDTGLFTVGCVTGKHESDQGIRYSGYVEFAFNSRSAIQDAARYFPIFFHFCRFLHETAFDVAVQYNWELQGATFLEANDVDGFTCSVVINTSFLPDPTAAWQAWELSLQVLAVFLASVPAQGDDMIYAVNQQPQHDVVAENGDVVAGQPTGDIAIEAPVK